MFLELGVNYTFVLLILRMSGPASTGIKERCRVFVFMPPTCGSTEAVNGRVCNYLSVQLSLVQKFNGFVDLQMNEEIIKP